MLQTQEETGPTKKLIRRKPTYTNKTGRFPQPFSIKPNENNSLGRFRIINYEDEFPSLQVAKYKRQYKKPFQSKEENTYTKSQFNDTEEREQCTLWTKQWNQNNRNKRVYSNTETTPCEKTRIIQNKKKNEVNKEDPEMLGEEEKKTICAELEYQQEQHTIHSCEVARIAPDRLHRPRKKGKLEDKEIYQTLFKIQREENKTVPVLTLNAKLTNHPNDIKCIIDTGCNISLINSRLVNNSNISRGCIPKVTSANSSPINILGTTEVTLEISNIIIKETLYVTPDISSEVILGNRFLNKNKIEINFETKEIIFNLGGFKHKIKMSKKWLFEIGDTNCYHTLENKSNIIDVKCERDIIIAPHQHIRVKITLPMPMSKTATFEQEKSLKEKKKCHIYLIEGNEYLNIYNASNTHKHINANTILGYCTEEEIDNKYDKEITPHQITPSSNPNKKILRDKDDISFNISPHLTNEEHNKVVNLLEKYKSMFTTNIKDLTPANLPPVSLETIPNAQPVNSPPYKQNKQEREELNKLLDELKEADILEECPDFCEFASPVFITRNKDKSPRLVGDMRKINQMLKPCIYPTPSVNLVLNSLNNANSFTKLDLKGAYHQLLVREQDRQLLTIKTQDRLLRYKRLTMGLKVSSALFSKAILALLNKHLYNKVVCYIDDVIVYGKTFEQDLLNLETTLKILFEANLKLNTQKCKFLYEKVDILGYTVSNQGILPQKSTVTAIQEFKTPNCVRKVRQFLGSSSFFRKHIKNYADITLPLTNLIKDSNNNIPFKWTEDCEKAFIKIKEILTNPPLLKHWKDEWEASIYVDSSLYALGACLTQTNPDTGQQHPIAYLSKKYTETQQRYSNAEREMMSLVYAVNYWREFTLGRKITIFTDCQALVHYQNFKHTSSRLNRLALSLVDYDITIKHKKGTNNTLADSLSRNPTQEILEDDPFDIVLNLNEVKTENFEELQEKDPYLQQIKLSKISPDSVPKKIRHQSRKYLEKDGLLYYKHFNGKTTELLLAIPREKVDEILRTFHDNIYSGGHFSKFKTLKKIKERYHWPQMEQDVQNYTQTCEACQLRRTPTYKQFDNLTPQIPPTQPFQRLIIDYMGPITQSRGYKYILMITDCTTRMIFARCTRSADAKTTAKILLELFCQYGYAKILTHDQGTHFMGSVLKQLLLSLGIQQKPSPPAMYRIQGLTERMNLIFKKTISHYIENEPNKWSDVVKYVTFAYNTSVNSSTGHTPFYLMFGRQANVPSDYIYVHNDQDVDILKEIQNIQKVRSQVPQLMKKAQETQKKYFDSNKRDLQLNVGEEVLVRNIPDHSKPYNKFNNIFRGPYFITERINDTTYMVLLEKYGKMINQPVHIARLKPFHRR